MNLSTRKLVLTTHITVSVGWIGAVLAYLALVVAAMADQNDQTLRAYWMGLELLGWYVIVPLALAALFTGLVIALGTPWGLIRHYWVLTSLLLTVVATGVLLLHMPSVSFFARVAVEGDIANVGALRHALRGELLHAGPGLLVLLAIEALNVYKPRGLTVYGRRASEIATAFGSHEQVRAEVGSRAATKTPRWVRAVWIHAVALVLLFAILHLTGGGLPHH